MASLVEEAMDHQIIEEVAGKFESYRFVHALTQQTLEREIPLSRRIRFHARIAEILEEIFGDESDARAIELSRHFDAAEPVLGAERALYYLAQAGAQSLHMHAYDDALKYFTRAIELCDDDDDNREMLAAQWHGVARAQAALMVDAAIYSYLKAFSLYHSLSMNDKAVEVASEPCFMCRSGIRYCETATRESISRPSSNGTHSNRDAQTRPEKTRRAVSCG